MTEGRHDAPGAVEDGWIERTLAEAPDEPAPGDGLARVMAEIAHTPQAPVRGAVWTPALAATFAGVLAGAAVIAWVGAWLLGSPQVLGVSVPSLHPAAGLGLAALVFFGAGSFATLALAPVLLLESSRRRPLPAGR